MSAFAHWIRHSFNVFNRNDNISKCRYSFRTKKEASPYICMMYDSPPPWNYLKWAVSPFDDLHAGNKTLSKISQISFPKSSNRPCSYSNFLWYAPCISHRRRRPPSFFRYVLRSGCVTRVVCLKGSSWTARGHDSRPSETCIHAGVLVLPFKGGAHGQVGGVRARGTGIPGRHTGPRGSRTGRSARAGGRLYRVKRAALFEGKSDTHTWALGRYRGLCIMCTTLKRGTASLCVMPRRPLPRGTVPPAPRMGAHAGSGCTIFLLTDVPIFPIGLFPTYESMMFASSSGEPST